MSEQSFWRNPLEDISKHWPVFISSVRLISQTGVAATMKRIARSKRFWRVMTGYMFTLTLGAMIQKYFWTRYGFSSQSALVVISFWIMSLWLLAAVQRTTKDEPS